MAAKKNSESLDDLLSLEGDKSEPEQTPTDFEGLVETPEEEAPAPDITSVEEDDADAEIARLKAELAKPLPSQQEFMAPKKESELTPKERELRELRDQMARRQAQVAETSGDDYDTTTNGEAILIHVLVDGFTINGQVCYRGREIEFFKSGKAYQQTLDRNGNTWLDLTEDQQYERWGEPRFGYGPWPFKKLSSLRLSDLPEGSTQEDLEAVKRAAAANDRRAPVFTN